jgi:PRC-barrel domain
VEIPDYGSLDGATVTNEDGEKLGKIEGLFVDDQTNVPTWVAVRSGLFGNHHSLVPLAESKFVDGELFVPYSKDDLAIAPHHDPDVPLGVAEEQLLFAHYNVAYGHADTPGPRTGVDPEDTGLTGSPDAGSHPVDLADADIVVGAAVVAAPDVEGVPGLPTTEVDPDAMPTGVEPGLPAPALDSEPLTDVELRNPRLRRYDPANR